MKEKKVIRNLEGSYWQKYGQRFTDCDSTSVFENFSQAMLEARNASKICLVEIVSVWINTDVEETV